MEKSKNMRCGLLPESIHQPTNHPNSHFPPRYRSFFLHISLFGGVSTFRNNIRINTNTGRKRLRIQRRSEHGYGNRHKNCDKGFDKLHNDLLRTETCNTVYGVTVDVFIFSSPFYIGARNLLVIKRVIRSNSFLD